MGFHNHHYPRPLIPNTQDPSAVDFRAFYPYTPNEVKHRKRTTSQQLKVLEAIFKRDTKPNAQLRQDMASELGMTARGVQVWFQNRRAKEKARAGRVSLAANAASSVDELKEEDDDDDGAFHNIVKTEAVPTDLLLRDETPSEQLNASPSPLSDTNPPSHAPSPPELHVITDSAIFNWTDNEVNEPPPDSATSCTSSGLPTVSTYTALPNNRLVPCLDLDSDLYSLRRGSLPVTSSLYQMSPHVDPLDPLVRRCSVDASLQRLALHPYANFARAKNSALYGAGVGVAASDSTSNDVSPMSADGPSHYHLMNNRHYGTHRLQRRFVSSSALSAAAQYGSSLSTAHYSNVRRLSMDSRASRISSLQRMRHSPSPSPLSTYSATTRMSLPEPHLYPVASRPVSSPIPGPLPMPGFQFGAASSSTPSIASPSSIDSERNSPDSLSSFYFGGDEENQASPPYEIYTSRFGSVASVATSESSLNSGYYGGPTVDQDRRNSTCTPQYYASPPDLDIGRSDVHNLGTGEELGISTGIVVGYSPPDEYTSYGETDGLPLSIPDICNLQHPQSDPLRQAYASPITPAISTASEIPSHGQDAPSMPISTSSELAFALERKHPELKSITVTQSSTPEAYVNFGPGEQISQSPAEHYHTHQQPTYYTTEVQTYHQEQPVYHTTYSFTGDVQVSQQPPDFGIYSTTGDYSDPLVAPPENVQTAESFVTYS